ncbi:MAG TPA: hypothetical protein VKH42_08570 [Vicinamibacterales bacterium]|nr:hypothetical protein [Vicinamibacterales bacterium]
MKRSLTFFFCAAAFAAASPGAPAPPVALEDAPVPGGVVEFARALGIRPVPDRARFLFDMTRLVYEVDRPPVVPAVLQTLGRRGDHAFPTGDGDAKDRLDDDLIQVPLTAEVWSGAVFKRKIAREDLVAAIVSDRQAALLCHGLLALDDDTLRFFADQRGLITRIVERSDPVFAAFSTSLHVSGGRILPPGADAQGGGDVVAMWEAAVGEKVTRPERFIQQLLEANEGRLAYLYDTVGQLDPARRAFALGLWMPNRAQRLDRFRALAGDGISAFHEWHPRSLPFGRSGYDLGMVLSRVEVGDDGTPKEPASRGFWTRAFAWRDADDPRVVPITDDESIDAAWLTSTLGAADVRQRGERLDQMSFANRVFGDVGGAGRSERGDALVATRAFSRYRMLMLTLERVGVRDAGVYVAAARQAARVGATTDGRRAFVALGQYQGALALVARAVRVRSIDAATGQKLIARLAAVPLSADGRYGGGIARWLRDDLLSAASAASEGDRRGPGATGVDIEHRIIAVLSGPPWSDLPDGRPLMWEGQQYRLDLGAADRLRLNRVRERQLALPLDVALTIAEAGRAFSSEATPLTQSSEIVASLTQLLAEVRKRSREEEADAAAAGAGIPRDQHETLQKAIDEISKAVRQKDVKRLSKLAEPVLDLGDDMLAYGLISMTYACDIGDPDGAILLADDVSQRHDFGLAIHDSDQRLKVEWALPRQDIVPGAPWHITGSILGLDVALASLTLRRISPDPIAEAPALTSTEREAFAASVSLMNPFDLHDADRDAIAASIERGRTAVAAFDAERLERAADRLAADASRRRALRWSLAHEADRMPAMFTLAELLVLGGGRPGDFTAWGMSMVTASGCLCSALQIPRALTTLGGHPQFGLTATVVADLNLHVAMILKELQLPAALTRLVASGAMQDFIDHVRPLDDGDWLTLARSARTISRDRIEDYLAIATAVGPLVPIETPQP